MTAKHLDGYYANGYTLSASYRKLVIEKTANVRGDGVTANFVATVVNRGAVYGFGPGVYLKAGGSLINGSAKDTSASVSGYFIAVETLAAANVTNFGRITSYGFGDGVVLDAGGSITNGSIQDTTATIFGVSGVTAMGAAASITNFGTIYAVADYLPKDGVTLGAGGSIMNGSAHDSTALIGGYYGVRASGAAATIVNFGTIKGFISVELSGADSEVTAEAGSTFIGTIEGGGGRLDLAGGGTGTITGLGGEATLTGAVEADFSGFGSYEIAAGGSWTLSGPNTLNAGAVLVDEGRLINRGALTLLGTLSIAPSAILNLATGNVAAKSGDVTTIVDEGLLIKNSLTARVTVGARTLDAGVVEVATGTLDFTSHLLGTGVLKIDGGATLEADAAAVSTLTTTFNGPAATLALKIPNAFLATIGGMASGDIIDLLTLTATGASVNADDQLVVVNGARTVATLQLSGDYSGATFTTASDGHGGTNVELVSAPDAGLPSVQRMTAAMASLIAPVGVTAIGHSFPAGCAPTLANPHVHLQ